MKKEKEVTIYDIANALNVSASTVSRALHDNPLVSKATRRKIQNTAEDMGFRPNTFASNLRRQKTFTIGVIMHELRSNFMTSALAGIEKVTTAAGYDLIIAHSSESYQKEKANVLNLFKKRVDGLMASLAFDTPNLKHYLPYREKGIPVVFYDRVEEQSDFPKVIIDNFKCGYEVARHLIEEGCSRIVLITANRARNVYAERYRGYLTALKEAHIVPEKDWILEKDLSVEGAEAAAEAFFKINPVPDGAFITHDLSAAVFMRALRKKGIRVPEDVAIVGFNNDAISRLVEPPLTTVNYPGQKVGEAAASHLINLLEGASPLTAINTITIQSELIIRASSRKKKNKPAEPKNTSQRTNNK